MHFSEKDKKNNRRTNAHLKEKGYMADYARSIGIAEDDIGMWRFMAMTQNEEAANDYIARISEERRAKKRR